MNRLASLIALAGLLAWSSGVAALAQEPKSVATESEHAAKSAGESSGKAKGTETDPAHVDVKSADTHVTESHGAAPHAAGGEAHGDHAHDPHDLSHANATSQLRAAQELRFDLGIATFLVFLLLLGILAKFAWGPIAAALEKRESTIAQQIADARHASELASKQLQEYERKLAAATEEARAIVTQAKNDALSVKDRIVAEAQEAAQKERERAVADIGTAKNEALREIAAQSVKTAVQLASNIVRREIKPEDHDRLIGESLQQFSKLN